MYSPKIDEDLIPRIYQVSKRAKIPMTRWINQNLERALADQDPSLKHPVAHHHDTDTKGEMPP